MITIMFSITIFLRIIEYFIILDVILSWLHLLGLRLRIGFLRDVLDPLYDFSRKYVPTKIGMFDFTPIILLLIIGFIRGLIILNFPELQGYISNLSR